MKYLQPKKKGAKIRISPNQEITIMMYNIVRVEERFTYRTLLDGTKKKSVDDAYVTIMALTGAEMKYQRKAKMWTKKRYIVEMLKDKIRFKITDDFKFINLDKCLT